MPKISEPPPERKDPPLDKLQEIIAILGAMSKEDRERVIKTVTVFFGIYIPNDL